ncbi:MAG: DUF3990 domain-containing protein [Planctomycetaceae bacterium]|jgi:hypothetical protein|nr:DUF3990 domain-containing protein [Planctomycetaceae bacterium]
MLVYHGSYREVIEIDISQCRPHRDFGQGFYVTNIRTQAEYWAIRMGRIHNTQGVVTEYTFYDNAFTHWDLQVLRFDSYTEAWLDFVIMNRDPQSPVPAHDYDIVEGPVANDNVADRIHDYLDGFVAKPDFLKELSYHKPTHQICLCTLKSLQMIAVMDRVQMSHIKHIIHPVIEKLVTELGMNKSTATDTVYNSETFAQLSDKSTGLYQKTFAEIYQLLSNELKR